jgi:hypothetical protein
MIHAETFGTAKLVAICVGKIFLNGTCNSVVLCCGVAVPARGVIHPGQGFVGAMHGAARTLIG